MFFLGRLWVSHTLRKQIKNTLGSIDIFPEEQNPIGLVVTGILRDRKTDGRMDGQTDIVLFCIIDKSKGLEITRFGNIYRYNISSFAGKTFNIYATNYGIHYRCQSNLIYFDLRHYNQLLQLQCQVSHNKEGSNTRRGRSCNQNDDL